MFLQFLFPFLKQLPTVAHMPMEVTHLFCRKCTKKQGGKVGFPLGFKKANCYVFVSTSYLCPTFSISGKWFPLLLFELHSTTLFVLFYALLNFFLVLALHSWSKWLGKSWQKVEETTSTEDEKASNVSLTGLEIGLSTKDGENRIFT